MDKKVTVLTPNCRRQNVRISSNTTLLQVLDEACQKHGFSSEEHGLKHHNKEIDLSQMFRFSGLPNNCLLEMFQTERKRIESEVDICVILEDGSRVQGQFIPTNNLWHVLSTTCEEAVSRYESPVVIYMRQEILGKEQLTATTLRSLGITGGRAMVRFVNKNLQALKTQASVYHPAVASEAPSTSKAAVGPSKSAAAVSKSGTAFSVTKDLVQSLKKTTDSAPETATSTNAVKKHDENEEMEIAPTKYDWGTGIGRTTNSTKVIKETETTQLSTEMEDEPEVHVIGERSAVLYSLDSIQKQVEDLPDSFFDLTVDDLKLVLKDLKKVVAGDENAPLLTEKLRDLEKSKTILNKMAQYKNCIIRVQFSDRYVLQGIFKPIDKISDVQDFVRKFLQNVEQKFYLFTTPPKFVMSPEKTLLEVDCVPTAVLHFATEGIDNKDLDSGTASLRPEFLKKLTTPEGAIFAAKKSRINRLKSTETETNFDTFGSYESNKMASDGVSTGAIPKRPRHEHKERHTTNVQPNSNQGESL